MNSVTPTEPIHSHDGRVRSWTVVIPVKAPAMGKSRLGPAVPPDARAALARAFALDTIAAALAARSVARVVVVGDDPSLAGGAEFLAEPAGGPRGLLPAIRYALRSLSRPSSSGPSSSLSPSKGADASAGSLRHAQGTERVQRADASAGSLRHAQGTASSASGSSGGPRRAQGTGVAVLLGDLPALHPDELDAALEAASRHPLAFVRDADGTGTTLATANVGVPFEPRFGPASAALHAAAGFVELEASDAPGLTRDVDTVDSLQAVLHGGVGERTAEVVAHLADSLLAPAPTPSPSNATTSHRKATP